MDIPNLKNSLQKILCGSYQQIKLLNDSNTVAAFDSIKLFRKLLNPLVAQVEMGNVCVICKLEYFNNYVFYLIIVGY